MIHEEISFQAGRLAETARLNAPPIIVRRELQILTELVEKLPSPKRLPPRKQKEKWSEL